MTTLSGIEENLKFLILELTKQLEETQHLLRPVRSRPERVHKIFQRDDYINSLQHFITSQCYSASASRSRKKVPFYQCADIISRNLEHIGDHAVNIIKKTRFIDDPKILKRYSFKVFFQQLISALQLIEPALMNGDLQLAGKICQADQNVDSLYKEKFRSVIESMKTEGEVENLISVLFIYGYLERMGDAVLNIGEAIISMVLGDKIKMYQYKSFREMTEHFAKFDAEQGDLTFQSMGQTRSGCQIDYIEGATKDSRRQEVVFKEGDRNKVAKERGNLGEWGRLVPGLVPRVLGYHERKTKASLLVEYLHGRNLRDIILQGSGPDLQKAMNTLMKTVEGIWDSTRSEEGKSAQCIRQLARRLPDVFKLHPEFRLGDYQMGEMEALSLEQKLNKVRRIEQKVLPPFYVFIHGDFNIDNLIYDQAGNRIHFLDVYRSEKMDYVQDISVFIISNFRLPVLDEGVRSRLNNNALHALKFSRAYANRHDDRTFQLRLAFGLIRSFMTSTRFILDKEFAKLMFLRGVYLVDRVLAHGSRPWEEFVLPEEIILY